MKRRLLFVIIVVLFGTLISCKREPLTSENSKKLIGKWRYDYTAISDWTSLTPISAPESDFTIEFDEKGYVELGENGEVVKYRIINSSDNSPSYIGAHIWANSYTLKKSIETVHLGVGYYSEDSIVTEEFPIDYNSANSSGNPPIVKVNVFKKVN